MIFEAPVQLRQSKLCVELPPLDSGCAKRANLVEPVQVVSTIQVWHYDLYEKDTAHR